ncbi:hypothetical protein ONZ45_g19504 [Pleurotus djamor]|nr:hypothetical protein ONZ45_g19504 [Pleurotus djamor]
MSKFIELNDSESQASNSESSNLRTPELPTELWIPILHEVGNPHRVDLRALPLVCRRLYCLTTPLLYEHISPKPWISERILPSLVSNSHLHHTTQFEAIVGEGHLYPSISTILSAMKNLQRMSLALLSFNRFPLASIPTLTHFALTSDCPKDALCRFLSAQPFLEFLELSIPGAPRIKLPESALINLKTFIGPREILVSIAQGRQIEHFDSECSYTTDFLVAESRHLRSLKDTICICPIMGLLDNIEYLDFTARSMEEVRIVSDLHKHDYSPPYRCTA